MGFIQYLPMFAWYVNKKKNRTKVNEGVEQ